MGTALHIEHIEQDDPGLVVPYWHNQHLLIGELDLSAARGIAPGFGIGAIVPLRVVRDRIRFEDLAHRPYVPPNPDTHHRNETLNHVADPQLAVLLARQPGPWSINGSIGTSIPIGRTEPNPFALGRLGLPHQHIQFGTGTWDPMVSLSVMRPFDRTSVTTSASMKLSFYKNSHGFQAGNRYNFAAGASRKFGSAWGANAGLAVTRESPETWDGRIEEEGNLGRTDLIVSAGVGRGVPNVGSFGLTVAIPIKTWASGEQVSFPVILSVGWTH